MDLKQKQNNRRKRKSHKKSTRVSGVSLPTPHNSIDPKPMRPALDWNGHIGRGTIISDNDYQNKSQPIIKFQVPIFSQSFSKQNL